MRKPNKAILRNALLTVKVEVHPDATHVLDGGVLLHKVRWSGNITFEDVCKHYVKYVRKNYGTCNIVFDGYSEGPSTKDHEHVRRNASKRSNTEVHCNVTNKINIKQDVFLANNTNKSRFIDMLSSYLREAGNTVVGCKEDADTEIAKFYLFISHI